MKSELALEPEGVLGQGASVGYRALSSAQERNNCGEQELLFGDRQLSLYFSIITSDASFCLQRPSWLSRKVSPLSHTKYFLEKRLRDTTNNKNQEETAFLRHRRDRTEFFMFAILQKSCSPGIPFPIEKRNSLLTSFCISHKIPQLLLPRQIPSATKEDWGTHFKNQTLKISEAVTHSHMGTRCPRWPSWKVERIGRSLSSLCYGD